VFGELALYYKVFKVLIVYLNCKGTIRFQLRLLEFNRGDYSKHLLIVDIVVYLSLI